MFFLKKRLGWPKYTHISLQNDNDEINATHEPRSSSEDESSALFLEAPDVTSTILLSKSPQLSKIILYFSFALALLLAANIAILPVALSKYRASPLSESELKTLPYGDARLGLDKAAEMIPPPHVYYRSWPDGIARVSRRLKDAVWGQGVQVYITVEDSTIMRFPVPSSGANACAISWKPPPELSPRAKDLTIKGDVTEIEVWQLIASSVTSDVGSPSVNELDYDTLTYSTLPVKGELLGVLDFTSRPNTTTVEFACPSDAESLTVEMRCQRVGCHVSFMQIHMAPRLGFELVRRKI